MKDFSEWINDKFPAGFGGYSAYHNLTRPWKPIRECFQEVKWAWQRVFKGYDDRATWGIDSYLADLIPKLASELKENNIGTPFDMWDGMVPVDNCFNYSEEDDKVAETKWREILEKIAEGFKSYSELDVFDKDNPEFEIFKAKFEEGFDLFRKYFGHLWD